MLICIAREFGSGGLEIGKRLADALEYDFYDQALVTEAASRSSISPEILEKADERKKTHGCIALYTMIPIRTCEAYPQMKLCFGCRVLSFWKRRRKITVSLWDAVRTMCCNRQQSSGLVFLLQRPFLTV